jgi:hypothetical protein
MSPTTRPGQCCRCMPSEWSGVTVSDDEVAAIVALRQTSDLRRRCPGVVAGRKLRAEGATPVWSRPAGVVQRLGLRPTAWPANPMSLRRIAPGTERGQGRGVATSSTAAGSRRRVLRYESVPGRRTRIMASRSPPPSSARLLVSEA